MKNNFRKAELKLLFYRLILAYIFYFFARLLFIVYNNHLLQIEDLNTFLQVCFYGLTFDTAGLMYINGLFILLSILPLTINTKRGYQQIVFYAYFIPNLIGYALNFIDLGYYPFVKSRTTISTFIELQNEQNKAALLGHFLIKYWHILFFYIILCIIWVKLYKKWLLADFGKGAIKKYILASVLMLLIIPTLMIGGIRGDFKYSTRPINLVDANRHIKNPTHADAILNTPFAFIRTINKTAIKKVNFVDQQTIQEKIKPIKKYAKDSLNLKRPNVVIFILESYGREYIGAFNQNMQIPNYKSYSPFLDSLAQHGLVFPNSFANGRKSIHGMSSVLAGIPSFEVAFTSSSYSNQPISSLVSEFKKQGYDTSFFHGSYNGSMGFLGFSSILGFDHYYGKTEYNRDEDFDGIWGIWDEPFLQYMKRTLDKKIPPFLASIFTITSHEPFIVPKKYENTFKDGTIPMHKVIQYTDFALKKFFKAAQKEPWFKNTLFVFTADHTNMVQYEEYKKVMNQFAVPIFFYTPSGQYKGVDMQLAQQIDIFPTIMDMVGYEKSFKSWGRSLIAKDNIPPFVITSNGNLYYFLQNNYICLFDGSKAIGFYDIKDKGLTNNLIDNKNKAMEEVEISCKAFIQDYMDRIISRKLDQ